MTETKQRSSR